jgi:hypothetical protein
MTSARKIKLKLPPVKPRNPLAVPASLRKAGSHRKSGKAQRLADKMALKKVAGD